MSYYLRMDDEAVVNVMHAKANLSRWHNLRNVGVGGHNSKISRAAIVDDL
ncbi:MAG: hypothetical protein U0Y68_24250 [Blastocatellia bacterium]